MCQSNVFMFDGSTLIVLRNAQLKPLIKLLLGFFKWAASLGGK